MLEMFLQSLVLGTLLTTTFFAFTGLVRRAAAKRLQGLPAGEPFRIVQPLDVLSR